MFQRQKKWPTILIVVVSFVILLSLFTRIIPSYAEQRAGRRIRKSQVLIGFGEERITIPRDVVHKGKLDQLLSHSLLANVPVLNCSLTSYQLQRYSSFLAPTELTSQLASFSSLKNRFQRDTSFRHLNYLFAVNLIDVAEVLPSLIRAIVSLIQLTDGRSNQAAGRFHVSIFENGSNDTTPAQLRLFSEILTEIGVGYTIISDSSPRTTSVGNRVEELARMRNDVLRPVLDSPAGTFDRIIFINDVHICGTDILELIYSHEMQDADLTCGMDYDELDNNTFEKVGYPLKFYDTWVARDMEGNPFYNMRPPSLDAANPPASAFQSSRSRSRYDRLLPIQVYSCWNGIAEFRASLFEAPLGLRFRALEGTDSDSECYLICKDIWAALTPAWEWFAADPKPTADNRLNRWRVLKWGSSKISKAAWKLARSSSTSTGGAAVLRGARIMVNPRVAVAYTQEMYQRARQDSNMKIFAGVRGTPQEQREEIEAREAVDWVLFPPTKVVTYKYSHWDDPVRLDTLS